MEPDPPGSTTISPSVSPCAMQACSNGGDRDTQAIGRALSSYLSPLSQLVVAPFSGFSGFRWTRLRRDQLRVLPDQRAGCRARAA